MLSLGSPAPPFDLLDQEEKPVALSTLRGHWVLLWWYPKASTAG